MPVSKPHLIYLFVVLIQSSINALSKLLSEQDQSMFKSFLQYLLLMLRSPIKVISNFWLSLTGDAKLSLTANDGVQLNQLLSVVNDENKHDLVFSTGQKSFNQSISQQDVGSFAILISVESCEQVMKRWAKERESRRNGEFQEVTKRLSFETWEDFFDIFSDKGKAMIEEFRKSSNKNGCF